MLLLTELVSSILLNSIIIGLSTGRPLFSELRLRGSDAILTWDSCKIPGAGLIPLSLLQNGRDKRQARSPINKTLDFNGLQYFKD